VAAELCGQPQNTEHNTQQKPKANTQSEAETKVALATLERRAAGLCCWYWKKARSAVQGRGPSPEAPQPASIYGATPLVAIPVAPPTNWELKAQAKNPTDRQPPPAKRNLLSLTLVSGV